MKDKMFEICEVCGMREAMADRMWKRNVVCEDCEGKLINAFIGRGRREVELFAEYLVKKIEKQRQEQQRQEQK